MMTRVVHHAHRLEAGPALAAPAPSSAPPIPVFRGGTGPRPGVDLTSNRGLHEVLDEDLAPDARR